MKNRDKEKWIRPPCTSFGGKVPPPARKQGGIERERERERHRGEGE